MSRPSSEIGTRSHRVVEHPRPQIAAFFDMDKTIIAENSATLFMKYRYQKGEISGWEVAKGLSAYLQYRLGVLDLQSWSRGMMLQFKGQREADLETEALGWAQDMVFETIYPEAERLIREHQRQGHITAIVSGSTKFVVEPLAARLGVEHFLYTRLEVDEGHFTGRVIEPICFEEGKIYWLEQFIAEQRIDLAKSYFYTDSITDLPLLELVGHPVVTNPDPILYRTAVKRRWPVRFFEPPGLSAESNGDRKEQAATGAS
jgi:putative phosphoserine phosphatase/1-acylglycerol-3-phosphate O-acyltransferase